MKQLNTIKVPLKGVIQVPGDKSISHRAVMFGSIAKGTTTVENFLQGEDCLSTISCFQKLGVSITQNEDKVTITSDGIHSLKEPRDILDVGNSGTTIRLMLGILSSLPFYMVLNGDDSIAKRPMKRVTVPLRQMGAQIDGRNEGNFVPLSVRGGNLTGIHYESPVASAQVKSAILLAGLFAKGKTTVTEPAISRDHTERMLEQFGVKVERDNLSVSVQGGQELVASSIKVPGDVSSAAFYLAAGAIVPNSDLTLENVGTNPTRNGILNVLKRMGANITIDEKNSVGEPTATISIKGSNLTATTIEGDEIPTLIDEVPIIALLATQAKGKTIIKDAEELKVKETDRIQTVVDELSKMGAKITPTEDGMIIEGPTPLHAADVQSHGDHRIGMMLAVASMIAKGTTNLSGSEAIAVSYPTFWQHYEEISK